MEHRIDIADFLRETNYCDFSNSLIQDIAKDYGEKYKTPRELAVALFYFVRDKTYYRVGFWNRKASETVMEGEGSCSNNTNLLVALLRAVGIPAGYGIMKVAGKDYFGPIVPKKLRRFIGKISTHVYTYVYLDGQWLKCDPSDDEHFSRNTQHFNPQSKLVDWDGRYHAELNLFTEHIISNRGPLSNIDSVLSKKMKWYKIIPVRIANMYISFLRQHGARFKHVDLIDEEFVVWLKKQHLVYYICYKFLKIF